MKEPPTRSIEPIANESLATVSGGTSHNKQLTTMLTQIATSIKDLASSNNQSDPTQQMMMMMMLGGGGGSTTAPPPAAPPVQPNIIDVNVIGGGRRPRKGW